MHEIKTETLSDNLMCETDFPEKLNSISKKNEQSIL